MLVNMATATEVTLINQVQERLASEFAHLPAEDVHAAVRRAYARFDAKPIRDFVPLFVERHARSELAHSVAVAAS